MKAKINLTLLITITSVSVLIFYACSDEPVAPVTQDLAQVTINFEKIEAISASPIEGPMIDQLSFLKNSTLLIDPSDDNSRVVADDLELVMVESSEVLKRNLNEVFDQLSESVQVLTVTLLEDENKCSDGLLIHYTDAGGNLKLGAYRKSTSSNSFNLIEFPANLVSDFTLNNVLFVARALFPKRNIRTIGSEGIKTVKPTNSYDDIALLRFIAKYNIPTKSFQLPTSTTTTFDTENGRVNDGTQIGVSEPCAVAVHHCLNGASGTVCGTYNNGCMMPIGHIICPRDATSSSLQSNQMTAQYNQFNNNLPSGNLYTLRDYLDTKPSGSFYVDAYYAMSSHFTATLDVQLLYDIVAASGDMATIVSAFNNNNGSQVLSTASYNEFKSVALLSAQKSSSLVYKDVINAVITNSEAYKNKNVNQIKSMLNSQPMVSP